MIKIIVSILLVLVIIYIVPFLLYGVLSALWKFSTPEGVSPSTFLLSVLVSKVGTAVAFVLILYFTRNFFGTRWFLYAFLWWVMFVFGEVGQTIGPNYSLKEAIAGIISETIYLPLSAFILHFLL